MEKQSVSSISDWNLAIALEAASNGRAVFPMELGKKPIGGFKNPKANASADPKQIKKWHRDHRSAGIMFGAFPADDEIVIDVDALDDGTENPLLSREGIRAAIDDFSLVVKTPGGGLHLWASQPHPGRWLGQNGILPKVDTRGGGTAFYIALPGQKRRDGEYQIISGKFAGPGDFTEPPKPFVDLLNAVPVAKAGSKRANAQPGVQNGAERKTAPSVAKNAYEWANTHPGWIARALQEFETATGAERIESDGCIRFHRPGSDNEYGAVWDSPGASQSIPRLSVFTPNFEPFTLNNGPTTFSVVDILKIASGEHWPEINSELNAEYNREIGADDVVALKTKTPKWTPLPTREIFHPKIVDFFASISTALDVDECAPALIGLGVASGCIGKKRCVMLRRESKWQQYANLWILVCSDPGTTKSEVIKKILETVKKWNEQKNREYAHEVKTYYARVSAMKNSKEQCGADGDTGARPFPPPVFGGILLEVSTPEAAHKAMSSNETGMLIASAEFERVYMTGGDQSNINPKMVNFMNSWFDGESIDVLLRGQGELMNAPDSAKNVLSVASFLQGPRWDEVSNHPSNIGSGHTARFLTAFPPQPPPTPFSESKKIVGEEIWSGIIQGLLDMQPNETPIELEPGARSMFDAFEFKTRTIAFKHQNKYVSARLKKMCSITGRIALVLHLMDCAADGAFDGIGVINHNAGAMPISAHVMARAIRLTEWFIGLMDHSNEMAEKSTTNVRQSKMMDWAENNPVFKTAIFQHRFSKEIKKAGFNRTEEFLESITAQPNTWLKRNGKNIWEYVGRPGLGG